MELQLLDLDGQGGVDLIAQLAGDGIGAHGLDGAVLLTLFGICQFMREYLEPKLLGGKMGIKPVQSLMAIYIGYELFGVLGLFLGPFGLVLIKSMWRVTG